MSLILSYADRKTLCAVKHEPKSSVCALITYLDMIPSDAQVTLYRTPENHVVITWHGSKTRAAVTFYYVPNSDFVRLLLALEASN